MQPVTRTEQIERTHASYSFVEILPHAYHKGHRFQIHTLFTPFQEQNGGPILVRTNAEGPFALFEFTGALPRAKLYAQWQTSSSDPQILQQLANPAFDPASSAFISADSNAPASSVATNAPEGKVEWVSYAPKKIVLKTSAQSRSLLLLNDHHDANWVVRVDGKAVPLLRCNYIMRGAMVEPGSREVIFSYEPQMTGLHISMAAIGLGVVLAGFLAFAPGQSPQKADSTKSPTEPPANQPRP